MKRRLAVAPLLAFVALFSASCSLLGGMGNSASTGYSDAARLSSASTEPATLRIAWWGGQPRHEYTLRIIERYMELNPHVTIEPEYASWDDYWKRLAPQAAGNELPDLLQMDLNYIAQYSARNQLADLVPYIGTLIDTTRIRSNAVNGGRIGERIYGFSLGLNALQVNYDPVLLQQATGLTELPADWTWDDYEELGNQAARAGLYFDTGLNPEVFFGYYLRTHGQSLYSADGRSLGYEDDGLFIDYFSRTTRMTLEGASPLPEVLLQVTGIEDDPLVKSSAISIWQWSNQYVALHQTAGRVLKLHPPPGPNLQAGMFLKPSMFFSISQNSRHKEEAARFIDFFVNDLEANKLMNAERGVPVSSTIKEELTPFLSEDLRQIFAYVDWAESRSSPMDPIDPIGAAEVIDLFRMINEQMKFQEISVTDAAALFRKEANAILARQ